jgi:type VI secretion system protein VasJ
MLERLRPERHWQWAAYGKHRVAKDYFKVGVDFPLLNSFSGWIENGYQAIASRSGSAQMRCSWRFWTREARRENVVCGIMSDSGDSLGRPYPLLIIGSGPLKGWGSHWDLVPLACENIWTQMEYLSMKTFSDLRALEEEVQAVRPPSTSWPDLAAQRGQFQELTAHDASNLSREAASLAEKAERYISLDQRDGHNQSELICVYHSMIKARSEGVPNVILMGGTLERVYIVFFRRPLTTSDFLRLWSGAELFPIASN